MALLTYWQYTTMFVNHLNQNRQCDASNYKKNRGLVSFFLLWHVELHGKQNLYSHSNTETVPSDKQTKNTKFTTTSMVVVVLEWSSLVSLVLLVVVVFTDSLHRTNSSQTCLTAPVTTTSSTTTTKLKPPILLKWVIIYEIMALCSHARNCHTYTLPTKPVGILKGNKDWGTKI